MGAGTADGGIVFEPPRPDCFDREMKKLTVLALCSLAFHAHAAEFQSGWQGSRQWIGPEYWASPIYDWETKDGAVEVTALPNRLLHSLSHHVTSPADGFTATVEVEFLSEQKIQSPAKVWAGFAVGVRGMMEDPRHVAVWPTKRFNAGIRADGSLVLGNGKDASGKLAGEGPVLLELTAADGKLILKASRGGKSVTAEMDMPVEELRGNVCLTADSPRRPGNPLGPLKARFKSWKMAGEGLTETGVKPFGPILWTQYTRQGNKVKLSAQMPPIGAEDAQEVSLEIRDGGGAWRSVGKAGIDPLARTAVFSFDLPSDIGTWEYRARYPWQGAKREWKGKFIDDPAVSGTPLKIAVMSCDNGYAFPLPTLTRNVILQKPNLVFFAGDQIYESYGGFGIVREPVETAMLDYLRKFYQFGWTWRELLKDCPSIILPDDHDVFQGNLWGAGGRHTKLDTDGGYVMAPEWVKAVERTQTAQLPDPVDPAPVAQGIGVYFTRMQWGGVPMAILEDRKFKSGPNTILPENRFKLTPEGTDVPGASLLGERQEKFLTRWAESTRDVPLRLVLSQTIFCKGHTHGGPELKKGGYDWDSNGWPRSGRQRALRPLMGDNTVMLHGDQHLGLMARQGVDDWNDGPWAFMVPGTANGWPRAWWPPDGRITGNFTDPFGNKLTVLAAANPEKGSNSMDPTKTDPPELTAQKKGSGHGLVTISPDRKSARFEMFRYQFDAAKPAPSDQFPGFPQTLEFK